MPFPNPPRRTTFGWLLAGTALLATATPLLAQATRPALKIVAIAGPTGEMVPVTAHPAAMMRPRACGTAAATPAEIEGVRAALQRWRDESVAAPTGGTVRVAFHVITARGEGSVSDARLAEQIQELNRDYGGSGYRFELSSVDRTEEPAWFRMTPGSVKERKAKQALAVDPARHLNIYVTGLGPNLAGWASLPWSASESHYLQGVVLDYAALAGAETPSDAWRVASHEVAHYLGLAPVAGGENAGVALGSEQFERMREVVPVYRPSLFTAPPPALAGAGSEISPAAGAEPEDGRVLSYRGAFPNPFQVETALRFTLPSSQPVSLRVYSVTGQLVRTLVDATLPPGDHSAMFRADGLPSGAYFAVLRAGSVQMSRTLVLIR